MDKILVEVYFPSLSRSMDIYIPENTRFFMIADMIERAAFSITGGRYVPTGNAVLCDRSSGVVFDINKTARQMCLHNGSQLFIM